MVTAMTDQGRHVWTLAKQNWQNRTLKTALVFCRKFVSKSRAEMSTPRISSAFPNSPHSE